MIYFNQSTSLGLGLVTDVGILLSHADHDSLTSLGLSLVTDVAVLVAHTDHDSRGFGATDDGREDGAGSVIPGEASLGKPKRCKKLESLQVA